MKAETTNSTTVSPSGKRSRDPEDAVYVDNLHSHKRYLSEVPLSRLFFILLNLLQINYIFVVD